MSAERDKMVAALREHVVPVLRARGFTGSFPHFRRRTDTAIHLIVFQFHRRGGAFCVEVASCPPDGLETLPGRHIPPSKVQAWDVHPSLRPRLGSTATKDHWFKFRGFLALNSCSRAARAVLPLLDAQAEEWWSRPVQGFVPYQKPPLNHDS